MYPHRRLSTAMYSVNGVPKLCCLYLKQNQNRQEHSGKFSKMALLCAHHHPFPAGMTGGSFVFTLHKNYF
jgi:hypothetical protein